MRLKSFPFSAFGFLFLAAFGWGTQFAAGQVVQSVAAPSKTSISVYIVDDPSMADLLVFRVDTQAQSAGNRGRWYFQDARTYPDKKVFFTNTPQTADLQIFFVDTPDQAGWVTLTKKKIFEQ